MKLPDTLLFASDAELAVVWGGLFVALALVCLVMDRRRMKAARLNQTGWVPWTGLFLAFAVVGGSLLALGVPGLIRG